MRFKIPTKIARPLKKAGLKLRHAAPTILVVSGGVGVIAGTVLACISTTKVDELAKEHEEALDEARNNPDAISSVKKVYVNTIFKGIKLYAGAACAIILGLVMIFGAHSILQSRNAILSAELLSTMQLLNAYKGESGGILPDDKVSEENGEKKVYEKTKHTGPYIRYFSKDTSTVWVRGALDANRTTVQLLQQAVQRKIDADIPVVGNDIFGPLGLEFTKTGYTDGYLPEKGKIVDFRPTVIMGEYVNDGENTIFKPYDEPIIRLDFNFDGYIIDKLDLQER